MILKWEPIVERAAEIVSSYGGGVTLRQLFYRLLSESILPNTNSAYKQLSSKTAKARREGWFPGLVDHTREIRQSSSWTSPHDAMQDFVRWYERPRTEGQEYAIYLGAEKATMLSQLDSWFSRLGIPIILFRGYGSQTYLDEITAHWHADEREPILIYAGDLDPSGEDIERDFEERTSLIPWTIERVAVIYDQIDELGLVKQSGKWTDTRAPKFAAKYGELFQIEVEAVEPDTLEQLYRDALGKYWDESTYQEILAAEKSERAELQELAESLSDES